LRSEAEMFRFLIGAIVYFAAVIVASLAGGAWWGLGVAIVLLVPAVLWFMGKIGEPLAERAVPVQPTERTGRILVLVPPKGDVDGLSEQLAQRGDVQEVVVVVPALATTTEQVTGQVDERRDAAQRQADAVAGALSARGLRARSEVGADEPLQALEDTLRLHGADEIVVAARDEALLRRARERFAMPVTSIS
jgi:rRNA-processing protein FCF1